ncbi:MipA/OmpV family protein [Sphingomonas bacterium]|uniref:MipA/OmpV family protein n=1 Tax=Sphingomonas bacterium TaxID=1895847 RepID=UPI001575D69F|nr:MipA/OmpV family protein [Sphingomonas bacterium]
MTRILLASAAALLIAAPALAQTTPDVAPAPASAADLGSQLGKDNITVGVGAAYLPDYDGSNNYRVVPAPVVVGTYKGHNFSLIGNNASFDLIKQQPGPVWNIEAGPVAFVNFNRTSNNHIDDIRVKRLPERDTAVELGGYVALDKTGVITSPYDELSLSFSLRHDVLAKNKSYVFTPSLTYLTPLSTKLAVGLTASGTYVGTKYARYYYGVSAADSRASGLPIFNPSHDWNNYTVGGFTTYSITGDLLHGFKVIAGGTYSRTEGPSARSPLTTIAGKRNQFIGAAGVAYTF